MDVLRNCACDPEGLCDREELDLICRKCGETWGEKKCLDPFDLRCWDCGSAEIESLPIAAE